MTSGKCNLFLLFFVTALTPIFIVKISLPDDNYEKKHFSKAWAEHLLTHGSFAN